MPISDTIKLSPLEKKTFNRFDTALKCILVLRAFFEKGFKTHNALEAIVSHYYPEISKERLFRFWHLRQFDSDIQLVLEDVFEKLKSE